MRKLIDLLGLRELIGEPDQFRAWFLREAGSSFFMKVYRAGNMLLISLLLARLLGKHSYGYYAYAVSWLSLLTIPATFGLQKLVTREVSSYRTEQDWNHLAGLLHWSRILCLGGSVAIAVIGSGIVWGLGDTFSRPQRYCLWVALAVLPLIAQVRLLKSILRGLEKISQAMAPKMLVYPTIFLLLIIAMSALGLDAIVAVACRGVAIAGALLVAWYLYETHRPADARDVDRHYAYRAWIYSALPLFLLAAGNVANKQVSTIMLGSLMSPQEAGVYDIAKRGSLLINFIIIAVNMPLAPTIASVYTESDMERLQRIMTKSARLMFFSALPIAMAFVFFGDWLLAIFGEEFTTGAGALAILALAYLINALLGSVGNLLIMTGHEWDVALTIGGSGLLNVGLNAILVPSLGMEGAALATAISLCAWNIALAIDSFLRLNVNPTAI